MIFWLIWIVFIGYAFLLAPPDSPDTWTVILHLSTGQWAGINPLIIALFNLMGIWPLIYAAVLLFEGSEQKFNPEPFSAAAFAIGAFAILPYLALRQPNGWVPATKIRKILDTRWFGRAIGIGTIGLLLYGGLQGNWPDFIAAWHSQRFIHVMSLDFCLLSVLFPVLAQDDLHRRAGQPWLWWLTFVPLVGAIAYLSLRPPLIFADTSAPPTI